MVHRLGRMEIGEASVVIVVTAPHRKPAFEAALEGINRLKKLVPIWKKEHFEDGEVWVEGEWDDSVFNMRLVCWLGARPVRGPRLVSRPVYSRWTCNWCACLPP